MAATAQPPQFSCSSEHSEGSLVLVARGELDLAAVQTFSAAFDEAFRAERPAHRVVIDLSALTYMASSGLGCLLALAQRARRSDVELELVPGPLNVMRLFEVTRTRDVLPFRTPA